MIEVLNYLRLRYTAYDLTYIRHEKMISVSLANVPCDTDRKLNWRKVFLVRSTLEIHLCPQPPCDAQQCSLRWLCCAYFPAHLLWGRSKRWHSFLFSCQVASYSCGPIYCSPPGPSVHGSSQARILEWAAISSSRASSWPRDWAPISCPGWRVLHHWAAREADSLEEPWAWGSLKAEGEGRQEARWLDSVTNSWTCMWAQSGGEGRTEEPGAQQSLGLWRIRLNWPKALHSWCLHILYLEACTFWLPSFSPFFSHSHLW